MTKPLILAATFLAAVPGAAIAAGPTPAPVTGPAAGNPDAEKVNQVIVYGDDPCPASGGDEITVCARLPDSDRYRIPQGLRTDPNDTKVQAWTNRARSIEYVGASGTASCSPTGGGGFTGCFTQIARAAKEERKTLMGSATWADLVEAERRKRLSTLDADSDEIEARVKAEEAAAASSAPTDAPK